MHPPRPPRRELSSGWSDRGRSPRGESNVGHLGWILIGSLGWGGLPGPGEVWAKTWGPVRSTPGQVSLPFPIFRFSPLLWEPGGRLCCQTAAQAECAVKANFNPAEERAGWAAVMAVQRKESSSSLSPCASRLAVGPDGAGLELGRDGEDRRGGTWGVWRASREGSW